MKIGGERAVEKYSVNTVKSINVSGREVAWYELAVTASTMDYAVKLVREGCASWTLVTAEKQSSGRGTHGRVLVHTGHGADKVRVSRHVAQSPAGHGVCFREPVDRYCAVDDVLNRGRAELLHAVVGDSIVDFV